MSGLGGLLRSDTVKEKKANERLKRSYRGSRPHGGVRFLICVTICYEQKLILMLLDDILMYTRYFLHNTTLNTELYLFVIIAGAQCLMNLFCCILQFP